MKTIEEIKEFLIDAINEMDDYIENDTNGYDDTERHDCRVAKEAYEHVLNAINNQEEK